jgi:hypothetical protein
MSTDRCYRSLGCMLLQGKGIEESPQPHSGNRCSPRRERKAPFFQIVGHGLDYENSRQI